MKVERSREQAPAGAPGDGLEATRMPGHWLLARLGKRVLRPGGLELTRCMISALGIDSSDAVVEFAPGLGVTARITLAHAPASYIGVERDEAAARWAAGEIPGSGEVVVGDAAETGLPDSGATVVYGEAMLTMQREPEKRRIAAEAYRLLAPGRRYGIHELCVADGPGAEEVGHELSREIHVGARPLTRGAGEPCWRRPASRSRRWRRPRCGCWSPGGSCGTRGSPVLSGSPATPCATWRHGGESCGCAPSSAATATGSPPSPSSPESRRRHEELWATGTSGMDRIAQETPGSESYGAEEQLVSRGPGRCENEDRRESVV